MHPVCSPRRSLKVKIKLPPHKRQRTENPKAKEEKNRCSLPCDAAERIGDCSVPAFAPWRSPELPPEPCGSEVGKQLLASLRLHISALYRFQNGSTYVLPSCTQCKDRRKHCDRGWPTCTRCLGRKTCERAREASWKRLDTLSQKATRRPKHSKTDVLKTSPETMAQLEKTPAHSFNTGIQQTTGSAASPRCPMRPVPLSEWRFERSTGKPLPLSEEQRLEAIAAMQVLIRSESAGRWTDQEVAPPTVEPSALRSMSRGSTSDEKLHSQPAQGIPPLWSRSANEFSQVTQLCPLAPPPSQAYALKVSRGGVARGILVTGISASHRRECITDDGRMVFEIPLSIAKKSEISTTVNHNTNQTNVIQTSANDSTRLARIERTASLYRAWRDQSPVYLFCGRTPGVLIETSGIAVLPCRLPDEVNAVAIGWMHILQGRMSEDGSRALFTMQTQHQPPEGHWWMPAASPDKGGWSRTTTRATWETLGTAPLAPSHVAAESRRVRDLLRATVCDVCECVVHRLCWSSWNCTECGARMAATFMPSVSRDIDFGKMPIETQGPRLDNGRALFIAPLHRKIEVWMDEVKTARYFFAQRGTSEAGMVDDTSMVTSAFVHVLSSGSWTEKCDRLLVALLEEDRPYRRAVHTPWFTAALHLSALPRLDPFLPSGIVNPHDDIDTSETLLEASEAVEGLVSRFNAFSVCSIVTACVGQSKRSLELKAGDDSGRKHCTSSQTIYLHLGSNALLSVTQQRVAPAAEQQKVTGKKTVNRRPHTLLNALVSHGDVVAVPASISADGNEPRFSLSIDSKQLCVGLVLQ